MGRRRGPSLTREQLIDAALKLADDEGAEAVRTSRLAKAVGLQPPSIYHHFKGNDDLQQAVTLASWRQLFQSFPEATDDAYATLRGMAHAYRRFAQEHPGWYRLIASTPLDGHTDVLATVVAEAMAASSNFGLSDDEAVYGLRALRSAIHGFVDLETTDQLRLGVSLDASYEWMVEALLRGMLAERDRSA